MCGIKNKKINISGSAVSIVHESNSVIGLQCETIGKPDAMMQLIHSDSGGVTIFTILSYFTSVFICNWTKKHIDSSNWLNTEDWFR